MRDFHRLWWTLLIDYNPVLIGLCYEMFILWNYSVVECHDRRSSSYPQMFSDDVVWYRKQEIKNLWWSWLMLKRSLTDRSKREQWEQNRLFSRSQSSLQKWSKDNQRLKQFHWRKFPRLRMEVGVGLSVSPPFFATWSWMGSPTVSAYF